MTRRPTLVPLGETEMEVLQHVWDAQEATVADVHAAIQNDRPVAYTTVLTVMKNLEAKGYLSRHRDGRQDRYRAARTPQTVRTGLLRGFLGHVFDGSPTALVRTLVGDERLTDDEKAELRALLERL